MEEYIKKILGRRSVTEFNYRFGDTAAAKIFVGVEIANERVFRFEFPERPGALMTFLDLLGERWKISMYNYRNHGAAYGRVMVGTQVPAQDSPQFDEFLRLTTYPFKEETGNIAYQTFLAP